MSKLFVKVNELDVHFDDNAHVAVSHCGLFSFANHRGWWKNTGVKRVVCFSQKHLSQMISVAKVEVCQQRKQLHRADGLVCLIHIVEDA